MGIFRTPKCIVLLFLQTSFLVPQIVGQSENSLDYNGNLEHSPLSPAYWRTSTPGSVSTHSTYWPFERTRLSSSTYEPLPLVTTTSPRTRFRSEDNYPIVLSRNLRIPEEQRVHPNNVRMYNYRPTQVDYRLPERSVPRRPVIRLGPEPQKISYGQPYVRVPYEEDYPRGPTNSNNKRPIIKAIPPSDYKVVVPVPEYGPFGKNGPFYRPENQIYTEDLETIVKEYGPFYGQGQGYAPDYGNYIPSLRFKHIQKPRTGEYDVEYLSGNGIYRKEQGYLKSIQVFNDKTRTYETRVVPVKSGAVSWTSPEGIPYSFSYIADENGYRPTPLVESTTSEAAAAYRNYLKGHTYAPLVPY